MKTTMKVLYTGLRSDRYGAGHGYSFEYNNFYRALTGIPWINVSEHPYDRILEVGKEKFNRELLERVRSEKPDALLAFMYTDEFDTGVLRAIREDTRTQSIAWFADDYWRFFNYSRHWAPHFNWVVTTYSKAVSWYRAAGLRNVMRSQWACDTKSYKPFSLPKDIEVSFVGQYKSGRGKVIDALLRAGINVQCFGFGWPNG